MVKFQNDDADYVQWLNDNHAGFVVNVPSSGTSKTLMLHAATCTFIKKFAGAKAVGGAYYKVCGIDRNELVEWASQKGTLKMCGQCNAAPPDNKAPVGWQLWAPGEVVLRVNNIEPLLASWNSQDDPAQIRLQKYLDELMARIGQLPDIEAGLYLHLDVDVHDLKKLLHGYDLENYLTPLFGPKRLDPAQFRLVSATKRVVGGSHLTIGHVIPKQPLTSDKSWKHFSLTGAIDKAEGVWKPNLRTALADSHPQLLPAGQVALQIAWRCHPDRTLKWVNWWKPTGDAMGPVLGEPNKNPFNPSDDRITSLALHLNVDPGMSPAVDVEMWWPATIA